MTPTDITESDYHYEVINLNSLDKGGLDDFQIVTIEKLTKEQAEKLLQFNLQNQKDAQEYRDIMNKVAEYHEGKQKEFAEVITPLIIKNRELQSQHKKLVDAIREQIPNILKLLEHNHERFICKPEVCWLCVMEKQLQNLLKESEKK